jgi:Flp pilus assembly protein TadB
LLKGLALAVAYHYMWWHSKEKKAATEQELVVLKETVIIDANGSAEITFAPVAPIVNPKLVLAAHGRPVRVEDIWHAGISVVSVQRSILYWRKGVFYSGHIDTNQPLKILLRNEGFAPATVQASIVVSKE